MVPTIRSIDHFVLTVASIDATVAFYRDALGFDVEVFGPEKRTALTFGSQKINLHEVGKEFSPRARIAMAGSGDFCLLTDTPVAQIAEHLTDLGIEIEEGRPRELLQIGITGQRAVGLTPPRSGTHRPAIGFEVTDV